MAWYNSILGGGSPLTNTLQSSSSSSTYPSGMMQSSSTSSSLGAGQMVAVNGNAGQSYWTTAGQLGTSMSHDSKVYALKAYTDLIGWAFEHHRIPEGTTSNDPKIAILKISTIGEVIKDVGVRTSEADFYIMRQPGE